MRRPRVLHEQGPKGGKGEGETAFVEIDAERLAHVFAVPQWLRDLGLMSWLLVGTLLLLGGAVWLMALTSIIVVPVITASIIAAVLSPVVAWLARHKLGRGGAAGIVLLGTIALGGLILVLLLSGVTSQVPELEKTLKTAVDKAQAWLTDAGVSTGKAKSAGDDASSSVTAVVKALLGGVGSSIAALASLAAFLSFTLLSLFFLLKDGPLIRNWVERHMGVPPDLGHTITQRTLQSLRGYFVGVTAVAAFNAIVISLGAIVLGLPQVGAIAVINFVAAYIPYLGAWSAGAFTVLIALGAKGSSTALAMAVIVLLANGALQQMIQPIAYGAALGIHPLAVLIVTLAGGALFGTIGLILAAPLTSAVVRISGDVARSRAAEERAGPEPAATPA